MKKKTILLLGANGQLGSEFQWTLAPIGNIKAYSYPEIDFSKTNKLRSIIQKSKPDIIVNAAGYTDVDKAEVEKEKVFSINSTAVGIIGEEAANIDALLVHFSTDYIFDGRKTTPYIEMDQPNPLNVYSESKLLGEKLLSEINGKYFIFRTSWLYSKHQNCFTEKVLNWARKYEILRVVDDQIGSPTWARELARVVAQAISIAISGGEDWQIEHSGIYHLGGDGAVSRFQWAKEILSVDPNKDQQIVKKFLPAKTSDFPTPAPRPLMTALNCTKFKSIFSLSLPDWKEALHLAFSLDDKYFLFENINSGDLSKKHNPEDPCDFIK